MILVSYRTHKRHFSLAYVHTAVLYDDVGVALNKHRIACSKRNFISIFRNNFIKANMICSFVFAFRLNPQSGSLSSKKIFISICASLPERLSTQIASWLLKRTVFRRVHLPVGYYPSFFAVHLQAFLLNLKCPMLSHAITNTFSNRGLKISSELPCRNSHPKYCTRQYRDCRHNNKLHGTKDRLIFRHFW